MSADIRELRNQCCTCVECSPLQKPEPLQPHEPASYPFQAIHTDLCWYMKKQYLVVADQFSGLPYAIEAATVATALAIIEILKTKLFPNYGLLEVIYSNGGPQFMSNEFAQMCQMYVTKHFTSSPEYTQSNGLAENTVKQMKRILHCWYDTRNHRIDNDKLLEAVLLFRNSPRKLTDLSPAELMFGRQSRDRIPTPRHLYLPQYKTAIEKKLQEAKLALAKNQGRGTPLPLLPPGTKVFIQDRRTKRLTMDGEVISKGQNEREYMVRDQNSRTFQMNRRFVKQRPDPMQIALPTSNAKAQLPTTRTTTSSQAMPTGVPEPRPIRERKQRVRFTVEDENDRQRAMRRPSGPQKNILKK
jgi:hypothetical protein